MSFPTHSTPCFTWHLPTDSLVFCAPALLLLGLTPETAPRTMADFLDRLPEPQRRFLQRQRQNPRSIPLSAVGGRDAVCQMTAVDEVGVIEIMPDGGGPRRRANCASWRQRPPRRPAGEAPDNR